MEKTKLEEIIEKMIALKRITSPTGIISDRAKRKYDDQVKEAYGRLKNKDKFSESSIIGADLDWYDDTRQRGMALGLREFEKKYPEYGKILRNIIAKHREGRRAHINFYLKPDQDLPSEFYINAIMSLGDEFDRLRAEKLYGALNEFFDKLGKEKEPGKYSVLLEE